MNKLELSLAVAQEIHLTRTFDAPKRLVLRATREPELIKRWLGNSCSALAKVDVDFRVGGSYRHEFRNPDGGTFVFVGTYKEISDDRVVHTESFEGSPGEAVITVTYVERAGKTTMKTVMRFDSQEIRDMVVGTGMEKGAGESYDNLETLLANL